MLIISHKFIKVPPSWVAGLLICPKCGARVEGPECQDLYLQSLPPESIENGFFSPWTFYCEVKRNKSAEGMISVAL